MRRKFGDCILSPKSHVQNPLFLAVAHSNVHTHALTCGDCFPSFNVLSNQVLSTSYLSIF